MSQRSKLDTFIDSAVDRIKTEVPGASSLTDTQLRQIVRDSMAKQAEEEVYALALADLTAKVLSLVRLDLEQ